MAKKQPAKAIREHWNRVRALGCVICGSHWYVTLHHCHGGSMLQIEGFDNPGWAQRSNDYLVIPLHAKFHTGSHGIDAGFGVQNWERVFGTQVDFLDRVSRKLGYNVWTLAGIQRSI